MAVAQSAWFSVRGRSDMPFQVYLGGRGIGKTYSALEVITDPIYQKFGYLRNTEKEIILCDSKYGNPYKKRNLKEGTNIQCKYTETAHMGIFTDENAEGEVVGYGFGLSTFAGFRGADFSDIDVIFYDEFIPEKQIRLPKGLGRAFLNFYETVNRNRELEGEPPVIAILSANAISLSNDVLAELGAIEIIQKMIVEGRNRHTDPKRGLYIELVDSDIIAKLKAETALYKMTKGNDFHEQALHNKFSDDPLFLIRKVELIQYRPIASIGEYVIFKHKASDLMHIAKSNANAKKVFTYSERASFKTYFYTRYRNYLVNDAMTFDNYATKVFIEQLLGYKSK